MRVPRRASFARGAFRSSPTFSIRASHRSWKLILPVPKLVGKRNAAYTIATAVHSSTFFRRSSPLPHTRPSKHRDSLWSQKKDSGNRTWLIVFSWAVQVRTFQSLHQSSSKMESSREDAVLSCVTRKEAVWQVANHRNTD